ncbi:hypothetical protein CBR_g20319 [Chara braunii]|uniref:AAA+ ATPase domain-containing protein n=1 Tax=Chara braunii TaxID=69332 RepID=A0A388L050_CHABU|nr:hypothetical protein CBR_g20319 [Chara braunii]|eukprot:GBG75694.1 hypothetical protein CBR_g20319 [Chara braunii]
MLRHRSALVEWEEKRRQEQRRNILVLVLRHLFDEGYVEAAERLQAESGLSLSKIDAADNVNLSTAIQEYEEYQEIKYGRRPKLVRKVAQTDLVERSRPAVVGPHGPHQPKPCAISQSSLPLQEDQTNHHQNESHNHPRTGRGQANPNNTNSKQKGGGRASNNLKAPVSEASGVSNQAPKDSAAQATENPNTKLCVVGVGGANLDNTKGSVLSTADEDLFDLRLLKPMPDLGSAELQELGTMIRKDIYLENPNVPWDSIVGLDQAKELLVEAVVMPHRYPQFFKGLLAPWKGVLLYGAPGTGKTMLAKAIATECKTTFFNISASTIVSKWRGDSEKLVRVLFDLARYHAPSTIFLDEVDALLSQRGDGPTEHESSRRMKTELLIQMDGLAQSPQLVFLLAATNMPWELDFAVIRRLEKRILVPLPGLNERKVMVKRMLLPFMGAELLPKAEEMIAVATDGYSGSDIQQLCKEIAMRPLRRLMKLALGNEGDESQTSRKNPQVLQKEELPPPGPVTLEDVEQALLTSKPAAWHNKGELYQKFHDRW